MDDKWHITIPQTHPKYPKIKLSVKPSPLNEPNASSKHILVIGGGVSSLMTSWILLDKGYRVTILAKDWAWTKDWQNSRITSQIAGALWEFPPGGCGLTEVAEPPNGFATIEHYRKWSLQSLEFYRQLNAMDTGNLSGAFGVSVTKLNQFFYSDLREENDRNRPDVNKLKTIRVAAEAKDQCDKINDLAEFGGQELTDWMQNLGVAPEWRGRLRYGYSHETAIVNTDKAMVFLMSLIKNKGAQLETRDFEDRKLVDVSERLRVEYGADAIVNATGLGAKTLAGDDDVYPVRGAIKRIQNDDSDGFENVTESYLVPAQKDTHGHPTKVVFIVPRSDEVLYVGSIIQNYNGKLNIKESSPEVEQMWKRARSFLPTLNDSGTVPWYPFAQGLRPFSKRNAKVRAEENPLAAIPIIHNYGHGGSGWTLAIGCAGTAVKLLERMLSEHVDGAAVNLDFYGGQQYHL